MEHRDVVCRQHVWRARAMREQGSPGEGCTSSRRHGVERERPESKSLSRQTEGLKLRVSVRRVHTLYTRLTNQCEEFAVRPYSWGGRDV